MVREAPLTAGDRTGRAGGSHEQVSRGEPCAGEHAEGAIKKVNRGSREQVSRDGSYWQMRRGERWQPFSGKQGGGREQVTRFEP